MARQDEAYRIWERRLRSWRRGLLADLAQRAEVAVVAGGQARRGRGRPSRSQRSDRLQVGLTSYPRRLHTAAEMLMSLQLRSTQRHE